MSNITKSPLGFYKIDPRTVHPTLTKYQIVDVREPMEFNDALAHVPGARLVPLGTLPNGVGTLDRHKPVLVVCRSGGRSTRASQLLVDSGFSEVYNLEGGMLAWNDAHLPVERA